MNPSVADLARRGIRVTIDGDRLAVDAPVGVLTPDLLQELRATKDDLMRVLGLEDQLDMPLSKFTRSSRCLVVYSRVLDEMILIAADNAELPKAELVAYRASELASMVCQSPECLRAAHTVRKAFDAESVEQGPDDDTAIPADLLLSGTAAELRNDITSADDDMGLQAICKQIDDAYLRGGMSDRVLTRLTDAVGRRAADLERKRRSA